MNWLAQIASITKFGLMTIPQRRGAVAATNFGIAGVVAVLDPRLAKAGYRWDLVQALPPMRRTKDPAEARAALIAIRDRPPA